MGEKKESRSQMYRAGVGAIVTGSGGKVLVLERIDVPGAWQLPQGGLEVGEEPIEAIKREIREETGIKEINLRLLSPDPRLLAYELPREFRSKKTGRGQVQLWFLFCYEGSDEAITLGDKKEFRDWKWMSMDDLVSIVVPFRKPVYQELIPFTTTAKLHITRLLQPTAKRCD
jgi:putative (di)nucleoside polyphosphate hydrolase